MSEQERELDVPEEVSGSILFCQTQLTYVQFSGELPLSDIFRKKLEFCPKWGGGRRGFRNPNHWTTFSKVLYAFDLW